jgi:hypothetical protein
MNIKVADEYRTNDLSLVPGGKTVSVTYSNGKTLVYDKVKSPAKYIAALKSKTSENGEIVDVKILDWSEKNKKSTNG